MSTNPPASLVSLCNKYLVLLTLVVHQLWSTQNSLTHIFPYQWALSSWNTSFRSSCKCWAESSLKSDFIFNNETLLVCCGDCQERTVSDVSGSRERTGWPKHWFMSVCMWFCERERRKHPYIHISRCILCGKLWCFRATRGSVLILSELSEKSHLRWGEERSLFPFLY